MCSERYAADIPLRFLKTQLPPTRSDFSKQSKSNPRWCSALAAAMPDEPAPITQTLGSRVTPAKMTQASSSCDPCEDAADDDRSRGGGGQGVRRRGRGAAATAASRSRSCTGRATTTGRSRRASSTRGESWEDGALREVEEEIGLRCRLGHELPPTSYRDPKGRAKVVRYWMMEPLDGEFVPSDEVDEMRWLPPAEADAPAQLRARPRAAARGRPDEPRPLPGPARRLGAARRPGRHADGRQRDRGDGRLHALGPQRQPRRPVRGRAREPTSWSRATRDERRARCSAATRAASRSARA